MGGSLLRFLIALRAMAEVFKDPTHHLWCNRFEVWGSPGLGIEAYRLGKYWDLGRAWGMSKHLTVDRYGELGDGSLLGNTISVPFIF